MKIIKIKDIEDCFDGSYIKELLFDEALSREFIHYLGGKGELEYFPTFARPFFRVTSPGHFKLKGVEGNRTIRIILYSVGAAETLADLQDYVNSYGREVEALS